MMQRLGNKNDRKICIRLRMNICRVPEGERTGGGAFILKKGSLRKASIHKEADSFPVDGAAEKG